MDSNLKSNFTTPQPLTELPMTELDVNSTSQKTSQTVARRAAALLMALTMAASASSFRGHANNQVSDAVFIQKRRGERNDTAGFDKNEVDELFAQFIMMINDSEERFEDGEISNLARSVINLVEFNGSSALAALNALVDSDRNDHAVAEILKWVGRINNRNNEIERVSLAIRHLNNKSELIRDVSALLLANLSLESTKDVIEQAINSESEDYIKDTLIYALKNLS